MTYLKKVVSGTVIIFLANLFSFIFVYLLRILLARNLTLMEFGLFYAVIAFISFFGILRNFGFDTGLTKFISNFTAKKKKSLVVSYTYSVFLIKSAIALFVGLILIGLSFYLSKAYFKSASAQEIFIFVTLSFIFSAGIDVLYSFFIGTGKTIIYGIMDTVRNILVFVITFLLMFFFGKNLLSVGVAFFIAPVIVTIIMFIWVLINYPEFRSFSIINIFKKKESGDFWQSIKSFVLPVFISSIGILGITCFDTIFLTFFSSLSNVGLYNVALPTANLLFFFSLALGTILFPIICEFHTLNMNKKIKEALEFFYASFPLLLISVFAVALFFSKQLIIFLYGLKFADSYVAFMILAVGVFFYSLANINIVMLNGIDRPKETLKAIVFSVIIDIILLYVLVPNFGIIGAAISTASSYVFLFLFSFFKLKREISFSFPIKNILITVILCCFLIAFLFVLDKFILISNIYIKIPLVSFICLVIYFFFVFLFRRELFMHIVALISDFFQNKIPFLNKLKEAAVIKK